LAIISLNFLIVLIYLTVCEFKLYLFLFNSAFLLIFWKVINSRRQQTIMSDPS
jgi:hypothetical protein